MTDANDRQSEFIAKSAFLLMIGGVLLPLVFAVLLFLLPGMHSTEATARIVGLLVIGFAFLFEVLALVLGIVCRQHLFGKVAMMGAGTVVALGVLVPALFLGVVSRTYSVSQPTDTPSVVTKTETKPQTSTTPKTDASTDSSPQTVILGKWRAVEPSLEQIWEFKKDGVVTLTSTVTGTNVIVGGTPQSLGSVSQSGAYTFINNKLVHIEIKEASAGIVTAPARHLDWDLVSVTPTAMAVHLKTETGKTYDWNLERVK